MFLTNNYATIYNLTIYCSGDYNKKGTYNKKALKPSKNFYYWGLSCYHRSIHYINMDKYIKLHFGSIESTLLNAFNEEEPRCF